MGIDIGVMEIGVIDIGVNVNGGMDMGVMEIGVIDIGVNVIDGMDMGVIVNVSDPNAVQLKSTQQPSTPLILTQLRPRTQKLPSLQHCASSGAH